MVNYADTLESLREELEQIEIQIAELSARRDALTLAIRGMSTLAGEATQPVSPAVDLLITQTALNMAVRCLDEAKMPLRAADIKNRLGASVPEVSYQSIYRALTRETTRYDGLVYKTGEKFGLRKWQEGRRIGPKPQK